MRNRKAHLISPGLTAAALRTLTIALAALASVPQAQPVAPGLAPLSGAYFAFAIGMWLLGPRLLPIWPLWLDYLCAVVDIGVVTGFLMLTPSAGLPLWPLYGLPIAMTTTLSRVSPAVPGGLSVLSYGLASWIIAGEISTSALWPVGVLLGASVAAILLSRRVRGERQEQWAWQEGVLTAQSLPGSGEIAVIATALVDRSRRLVRADWTALWWCNGNAGLQSGPEAGMPLDRPFPWELVTPELVRQLDHEPSPVEELGSEFRGIPGEAMVLRHDGAPVALLVVAWNHAPQSRTALRQRLWGFAPRAAELLAGAQARAATRLQLQRERILREAATQLAATLDEQAVHDVLLTAARSAFGPACLVERSTGKVLKGDTEVAALLVKARIEGSAPLAKSGVAAAGAESPLTPLAGLVGESLALLAGGPDRARTTEDASWLHDLAQVGETALRRCADYQALHRTEERLRMSLESLPAPVLIWDSGGQLVLASGAARALGFEDRAPATSAGEAEAEEVVVGEPPQVFERMTTAAPGGHSVVRLYREITRERQALRAKDELIALVGHELRSPLTSIHGYSQLMGRQLQAVQQQVERINRLIGDFLDATSRERGQLEVARERIDLAELVRAAAERLRVRHPARTLRLELAETLAPVEGDPNRLGQVLDNLLDNAAKYSPEHTDIRISVERGDKEVTVSVQDRGLGIAPEYLPYLFDRFYRVPSPDTTRVLGSGLGLSIVRDLMAAHGGRVWAESDGPGKGSTFRFALPIASPSQKESRPEGAG